MVLPSALAVQKHLRAPQRYEMAGGGWTPPAQTNDTYTSAAKGPCTTYRLEQTTNRSDKLHVKLGTQKSMKLTSETAAKAHARIAELK